MSVWFSLSAALLCALCALCTAPAVAGDDSTVSGTFSCTDAGSRSGTWVFDGQGHVHVTYSDGTGGDGSYRVNAKTARPDAGFGGMMHIAAPGTQLDGFLTFTNDGFALEFINGIELRCTTMR